MEAFTSIGMMGSLMTEQLHFDLVPGIAAITYGNVGAGESQTIVPPGICQLVQFGSTNVDEPAGASQRKLSTSMVTPCAAVPKTGLLSELVVSPQLSAGVWGSSSL